MAKKSIETLVGEHKTFLRAYNYRLDTGDNSLAKALILYPYSVAGKAILGEVEKVRNLHILSYNEGPEIDAFATDYKRERIIGRFATVTLTFYSTTVPTTNVVILAETQVRTSGTAFASPVTFSTVSEATFSIANINSYYSYDRDRYEFSVIALCDTIGTVGNVGALTINQISSPVSGLNGVANLLAAAGGEDEESDEDLKSRIEEAKTGRDLNVVKGLSGFVRSAGFLDAYPVRVEDAAAERSTGVDIFVIDNSHASATDTFAYDPSRERYYFNNRPVSAVGSVRGSIAGILSSSDYDVNIDNATEYRRSTLGMDYISFRASASLVSGETITVTYTYSESIKQVQDSFDLNENDILTSDILIKRAYPVYLRLNAILTLTANADGPATRNKARNALVQLLSTYRLGTNIQKSDLIVVLQEGYGDYPVDTVDAVIINSYYLTDEFGDSYLPTDEVISVSDKQYVVYGRAVIV